MSAPWLAIDAATEIASVAIGLGGGDQVAAARAIRGARQHAAQIIPLIQQVLALAGTRLEQVAGIIVGDGPGSFTGLRIAWAAAKGLAHERDLPLIAIPSLLGAAHAARGEAAAGQGTGPIAACFDALRGQVYGAMWAFRSAAGRVETIIAPELLTVAALARVAPTRPLLVVGDGAAVQRYRAEVVSWTGREPVPLEALPPLAASLLALAGDETARRPIDAAAIAEPIYGRPAEAQARWEARYGRPLPHSSR
jgi:tRNA threonylcarbamoyladenosine biosynthesis protein TsaB